MLPKLIESKGATILNATALWSPYVRSNKTKLVVTSEDLLFELQLQSIITSLTSTELGEY